MTAIDFSRPGPWRELWPHALRLMSHLEKVTRNPPWTFGGGTALMLRFDHRLSKDIDLFVPDVVVGEPLTAPHYERVRYEEREVRVETSAEIIAKKMWHRGDQAKARDLFDLCTVATFEPAAIDAALPYMERHAAAFLGRLDARVEATEIEFNSIEARSFQKPFAECLVLAHAILEPLIPVEQRSWAPAR